MEIIHKNLVILRSCEAISKRITGKLKGTDPVHLVLEHRLALPEHGGGRGSVL